MAYLISIVKLIIILLAQPIFQRRDIGASSNGPLAIKTIVGVPGKGCRAQGCSPVRNCCAIRRIAKKGADHPCHCADGPGKDVVASM